VRNKRSAQPSYIRRHKPGARPRLVTMADPAKNRRMVVIEAHMYGLRPSCARRPKHSAYGAWLVIHTKKYRAVPAVTILILGAKSGGYFISLLPFSCVVNKTKEAGTTIASNPLCSQDLPTCKPMVYGRGASSLTISTGPVYSWTLGSMAAHTVQQTSFRASNCGQR
jgi:hypothetical protein